MLTIKATRDTLFKPLQAVTGIVERRHTFPILSNVLIELRNSQLSFLATDTEIQIQTHTKIEKEENDGSMTLSAKKLQDILRALPDNVDVALEEKENRVVLKTGKSRFNLQSLPAEDFPKIESNRSVVTKIQLSQKALKQSLGLVQFSMAVQDIRYYLNGLLFAVNQDSLVLVGTDGHRLAYSSTALAAPSLKHDIILPRKTVNELFKLLEETDELVDIEFRENQVAFSFSGVEIISKVVDGKFPDYTKVIPTGYAKKIRLPRTVLQQALQRAAILSNEKVRGVRLMIQNETLSIICSNNEQEEAQEELTIDYNGEPLDIGFNITYLLDVLTHTHSEEIEISFGDVNSSALFTIPGNNDFKYVVMPMRI